MKKQIEEISKILMKKQIEEMARVIQDKGGQ